MRLTNTEDHHAAATCTCNACIEDRLAGCKNPNQCAKTAQHILDNLNPIFNPNTTQMRKQQHGEILFDPSLTSKNHLSECFRIFTNPDRLIQLPAYRLRTPRTGRNTARVPLTMYTDGSCTNNGKQNATR